jgi:hypothetical protein
MAARAMLRQRAEDSRAYDQTMLRHRPFQLEVDRWNHQVSRAYRCMISDRVVSRTAARTHRRSNSPLHPPLHPPHKFHDAAVMRTCRSKRHSSNVESVPRCRPSILHCSICRRDCLAAASSNRFALSGRMRRSRSSVRHHRHWRMSQSWIRPSDKIRSQCCSWSDLCSPVRPRARAFVASSQSNLAQSTRL